MRSRRLRPVGFETDDPRGHFWEVVSGEVVIERGAHAVTDIPKVSLGVRCSAADPKLSICRNTFVPADAPAENVKVSLGALLAWHEGHLARAAKAAAAAGLAT